MSVIGSCSISQELKRLSVRPVKCCKDSYLWSWLAAALGGSKLLPNPRFVSSYTCRGLKWALCSLAVTTPHRHFMILHIALAHKPKGFIPFLWLVMQWSKHGRSYSEFFTSGFRAMTERPPWLTARCTSTGMSFDPLVPVPTSSTPHHSSRKITSRRSSMIAPSTRSMSSEASESSQRDRRSSILSFPRLFDRRRFSFSENSLDFSPSPQSNALDLFGTAEITEVWITAGGPYTPSCISKTYGSLPNIVVLK